MNYIKSYKSEIIITNNKNYIYVYIYKSEDVKW